MSQVCAKCAHVNPPEAIFCYFDGVTLGSHAGNGRRVQPGSQPFPSQFVFPSGQACRNFDQFAIACQENWKSAVDLLKQGFLASFLGGIGRADLALAAKEAARFPDIDRGLDRFLARLPTQVLESPKLRAEPTEVNLGVIAFGANHKFELHLANLGSRLLYGSISSDCKWLTLGDGPGNSQKLFQFGGDTVIHVQIRGKYLRAGNRPLQGHLLVESNGGTVTVTVRVDVPPKPYPNGILTGAITPRQIAEKSLAQPKEAAVLFESGAVAKWFGDNGWVYPVRGPSAGGVGGVQQFFEALGLAKPPKVEVSHTAIALRGNVGQAVQATLELKTQEKRPVYAHAVCDQPWLDVSQSQLNGRLATIQVQVPYIPNRPGETLTANVTVIANGNQKFKVAVSLEIGGEMPQYPEVVQSTYPFTTPIAVVQPIPLPSPGMSATVVQPTRVSAAVAEPPAAALDSSAPRRSQVIANAPTLKTAVPYVSPDSPPPRRDLVEVETFPLPIRLLLHAVPAVLLLLLMFSVVSRDIFFGAAIPVVDDAIAVDPIPRIAVEFDAENQTMRFGLVARATKSRPETKLTYSERGLSNSTVVKLGGQTRFFGVPVKGESQWEIRAEKIPSPWLAKDDKTVTGMKSAWVYQDKTRPGVKVRITQFVEIVPGEPVEKGDKLRSYLDTCTVRYVIENIGNEATQAGLRIMIDTLIGVDAANDGVPFTVPGMKELVKTSANFESPNKRIPDFLQVLERPDLENPGIVGFMNLKLGGGVEPPSRVLLTHWTKELDVWDVPERPFLTGAAEPADSAVVLYWAEKPLARGAKREVGFSYGLGGLSNSSGKLGVSVGGNFTAHGDLTVVALVNNPEKGQKLTLKLPEGMSLLEGDAAQPVQMAQAGAVQQSPVTWRIRADREGTFVIEVQSSTGISQKKTITIKAKTIF